ncbi:sugar phosphate isomerase/epimerase family protein [Peribacillus butanolivorans]|uniref:sugar phosphate isomerase/epimerase family protein n=1 Tax=Peribacillus butanolivorans TaxID=421767 RepID=UPI0037C683F8
MDLLVFKAVWGMSGNWDSQLQQIAEAGFNGVETPLPTLEDEGRFRELLDKYSLELILHVYTGREDNEKPYPNSVEDHIVTLEQQAERAAAFKPILINTHSAKDSMPYDDQLNFFENAIRVEKQIGVPIGHETHRGRATYTPWSTVQLLKDLPDLHITADFSHWCNVCESMLEDQKQNLAIAIQHVIHIHGRVGFEHGPQVPDFRAPEYEYTLKQHEQWWDEICAYHQSKGSPYLTFTPEFGPPGYMHTQPFTKQPVVDLWEICLAMTNRFRKLFEKYTNQPVKNNVKI